MNRKEVLALLDALNLKGNVKVSRDGNWALYLQAVPEPLKVYRDGQLQHESTLDGVKVALLDALKPQTATHYVQVVRDCWLFQVRFSPRNLERERREAEANAHKAACAEQMRMLHEERAAYWETHPAPAPQWITLRDWMKGAQAWQIAGFEARVMLDGVRGSRRVLCVLPSEFTSEWGVTMLISGDTNTYNVWEPMRLSWNERLIVCRRFDRFATCWYAHSANSFSVQIIATSYDEAQDRVDDRFSVTVYADRYTQTGVNWGAYGSQDAKTSRRYAQLITDASWLAQLIDGQFASERTAEEANREILNPR